MTEAAAPTPLGKRHPTLYFKDGTLILRANDGTLYNVYRQLLSLKSGFFESMLTLPRPEMSPSPGTDGQTILLAEGSSDATAVLLPAQFSSQELEAFLHFVFSTQPWTDQAPAIQGLCAVLRISSFFAVDSGIKYATHHLENHTDLQPALRYQLGQEFDISHWIKRGFEELMGDSIADLTESDADLIGVEAYRVLVKTKAQVQEHRTNLAFWPPGVVHAEACYGRGYCEQSWRDAWMAPSGILGALLNDEEPGVEIHDKLPSLIVGGMSERCRVLTIEGIQDRAATPNNPAKKSELKREDAIISLAIASLS
ncbi:hypothetical protein C8J57DRAFT_1502087 [Mycena rebaudengoi]|nr:hypothetical protein C8J57DRAFT_1502087 [Mycena rebaudengoi]